MMEKVQKPSHFECYTQSSEPFTFYMKITVVWDLTASSLVDAY
jgi:hypothetical protein